MRSDAAFAVTRWPPAGEQRIDPLGGHRDPLGERAVLLVGKRQVAAQRVVRGAQRARVRDQRGQLALERGQVAVNDRIGRGGRRLRHRNTIGCAREPRQPVSAVDGTPVASGV
jgi:hypothetical protein